MVIKTWFKNKPIRINITYNIIFYIVLLIMTYECLYPDDQVQLYKFNQSNYLGFVPIVDFKNSRYI